MTRSSVPGSRYPDDWKAIAKRVKDEANWCCIRCGVRHDPPNHVLTVHHLDMNPGNSEWWNLLALCARCHLSIQSKVDLNRPWVMAEHSPWFRPYAAGWYAYRYLGQVLPRADVEARMGELLQLERAAVLGGVA